MTHSRGFTFIDTLFVLSVLALIVALSLPIFKPLLASARDTHRLNDILTLNSAFRQAAGTNNNALPAFAVNPTCLKGFGSCWNGAVNTDTAISAVLAPFLATLPQDPLPARGVGDSYVFYSGTISHGCTSDPHAMVTGNFILWEPDTLASSSDSACLGQGFISCCYAINCSVGDYCASELQ